MKELEKWEAVNAARNLNELREVLYELGPVEISGGRGAIDMHERLAAVLNGAPENYLTRNYGIRQQYLYLRQS